MEQFHGQLSRGQLRGQIWDHFFFTILRSTWGTILRWIFWTISWSFMRQFFRRSSGSYQAVKQLRKTWDWKFFQPCFNLLFIKYFYLPFSAVFLLTNVSMYQPNYCRMASKVGIQQQVQSGSLYKKNPLKTVFCFQNYSDLLWEKIVLVNSRLKAENLQNFWDH